MRTSFASAALAAAFGMLLGCASPNAGNASQEPAPQQDAIRIPPDALKAAQRLWARKLPGLITDLTVSKDGNAVLVTTVPDPDRPGVQRGFLATKFDGRGKVAWKHVPSAQIKSQALSEDGKLVVVSTYDEEMVALNARGKPTWRFPGVCRPVILSRPGRVLCYHDDDAEPRVAFDVLDFEGRKLTSFPITGDILALKVSPDERSVAISLTGGEAVLFGPDFVPLWRRKVEGEITDLALSNGSVAVLHGKREREITLFDLAGATLSTAKPGFAAEQVEFSGSRLLAYGHGAKGQEIVSLDTPGLKQRWRRRDSAAADYPIPLIASEDLAIVGYERKAASPDRSHLLGLDLEGSVLWSVPLATEEGAVLYTQSFSPKRSLLGVGTDDSKVTAYRVARAAAPQPRP